MKQQIIKCSGIVLLCASMAGCADGSNAEATKTDTVATASTETNKNESINLFDGKTLAGWHGYNKKGEVKNWVVEDGALVCLGAAKDASGGDLATDADYENFKLSWDWKLNKGSNSGVMYHVVEDSKYHAPYETGPEYQMIDDVDFPEKLEDWQKTGANYAMHTANDKKKVKPVGEWNSSTIIVNNGHVEHWLNGEKIVEFEAGDDAWTKSKKEGKWKDFPDYGSAKTGKIVLQDHGNKVYFKNITLQQL